MTDAFNSSDMILNEEIWETWLNSVTEFVFFKNLDGMYISVSKSNAVLAGFKSPAEMIGKYDYEIYPPEIARAFLIQDKQVIETKSSVRDEDWVVHPQLGKILIESVKSPMINLNGDIIGVQGVSRNITDRYLMSEKLIKTQQRLQAVLDNLPVSVWIKDSDNRYITVNKYYEDFYGVSKDVVTGCNVSNTLKSNKLFSDEDLNLLSEQDIFVLKYKKPQRLTVEVLINGGKHQLSIIKAPILKENGESIGLVGISHGVFENS